MKLYNFKSIVHIQTDLIGPYHKTCISVGMNSYPESENHEPRGYYSYDEILDLYSKGLTTDNLFIDEEGKPRLMRTQLASIIPFSIVNGIALRENDRHSNLFEYCLKHGYASYTPVPVEMVSGVKNMEILEDDFFKITYTIQPEKLGISSDELNKFKQLAYDKLIIGTLKRFASQVVQRITDGQKQAFPLCEIKDYNFNKENMTLEVVISKTNLQKIEFQEMLKKLDLQIYYFFNPDIEWHSHLSALMQCARDYGQAHWINEDDDDNQNNFKWFKK